MGCVPSSEKQTLKAQKDRRTSSSSNRVTNSTTATPVLIKERSSERSSVKGERNVDVAKATSNDDNNSSNNNNNNNDALMKTSATESVKVEITRTNSQHNSQKKQRLAQCATCVNKALECRTRYDPDGKAYEECMHQIVIPEECKEMTLNFSAVWENDSDDDDVDNIDGVEPEEDIFGNLETDLPHVESLRALEKVLEDTEVTWTADRHHAFKYEPPKSTQAEPVTVVRMTPTGNKRKIYAISDLHIGSKWAQNMERTLSAYIAKMMKTASEEILAVVLLGDIFEMWLDSFDSVPQPLHANKERWCTDEGKFLIKAVREFVTDHDVKVFYVRGNHDHEMTADLLGAMFGTCAQFVPGRLILEVETSDGEGSVPSIHRMRFSHGHEWDIFNSYSLTETDRLVLSRPIGYYISRAVATGGEDGARKSGGGKNDVEELLIGVSQALLRLIPQYLEDDLVALLSRRSYQKKLTGRLFEGALGVKSVSDVLDAKCRVSEDQYLTVKTLLEYPYLKYTSKLYTERTVFQMIKASTGDYSGFLPGCDEDVVVLAHTHEWKLKTSKNNRGNHLIYANTGAWTNCAEEYSAVVITPPRGNSQDGRVEIEHGDNKETSLAIDS